MSVVVLPGNSGYGQTDEDGTVKDRKYIVEVEYDKVRILLAWSHELIKELSFPEDEVVAALIDRGQLTVEGIKNRYFYAGDFKLAHTEQGQPYNLQVFRKPFAVNRVGPSEVDNGTYHAVGIGDGRVRISLSYAPSVDRYWTLEFKESSWSPLNSPPLASFCIILI